MHQLNTMTKEHRCMPRNGNKAGRPVKRIGSSKQSSGLDFHSLENVHFARTDECSIAPAEKVPPAEKVAALVPRISTGIGNTFAKLLRTQQEGHDALFD